MLAFPSEERRFSNGGYFILTIAVNRILAGVAVTSYVGTLKKAERSEAYSNLETLRLLIGV
ncbi:MAG: hypothetical protein AB1638_05855 [Nitrospirota bacterium]